MRVAAQTPKAHAAQGPVLRDARGVEQRVAAQTQKRRFRNNAKHALSLDADAADPAFDNYRTWNATNATLQRSAEDMAALATHVSTADYACNEAYAESEGEHTAEYLACASTARNGGSEGFGTDNCNEQYDDHDSQLCAQNMDTNECYEVVQSRGTYGRGGFNTGYNAAGDGRGGDYVYVYVTLGMAYFSSGVLYYSSWFTKQVSSRLRCLCLCTCS